MYADYYISILGNILNNDRMLHVELWKKWIACMSHYEFLSEFSLCWTVSSPSLAVCIWTTVPGSVYDCTMSCCLSKSGHTDWDLNFNEKCSVHFLGKSAIWVCSYASCCSVRQCKAHQHANLPTMTGPTFSCFSHLMISMFTSLVKHAATPETSMLCHKPKPDKRSGDHQSC